MFSWYLSQHLCDYHSSCFLCIVLPSAVLNCHLIAHIAFVWGLLFNDEGIDPIAITYLLGPTEVRDIAGIFLMLVKSNH